MIATTRGRLSGLARWLIVSVMLLAVVLPASHVALLAILTVLVSVWWFWMRKMF